MNIVIKVNDATKAKMIEYYQDMRREKTPPHAVFQAMEEDTIITLYESGKVMFQGISADIDANMWSEMNGAFNTNSSSNKNSNNDYYYVNSIGSDEVGTGDYFGPIVVSSAYVKIEDISFLESLKIRDSKRMSDEEILNVVPLFKNRIKYSSIVLSNTDYNKKYSKDINMNKIKAILHNKVLSNLISEGISYDYIIVDEFAKEKNYYNYLKDTPVVIKNITFLTKAEEKNLSVACASLISRYIFLKEFDKMNRNLKIDLPKGAGSIVDEVGKEIVKSYGVEKLMEIAKYNFKNTDKILKDN